MILIANNWWSLVLRGLLAIVLGVVAFALPAVTLGALILLFGAYATIEGIVNIVGAWRHSRHHERWGALLLEGIVSVLAGLVAFAMPGVTAFALVVLLALWAAITGVFEIVAAFRLRRHIAGEWLLGICGAISLIFAGFVLAFPLAGVLALSLWFGTYELIFGVLLTILGFRLRSWHKTEFPPPLDHAVPTR